MKQNKKGYSNYILVFLLLAGIALGGFSITGILLARGTSLRAVPAGYESFVKVDASPEPAEEKERFAVQNFQDFSSHTVTGQQPETAVIEENINETAEDGDASTAKNDVPSAKSAAKEAETSSSTTKSAKSAPAAGTKSGFVYANGTEFYINGKPYYFSGTNNYYLRYGDHHCVAYDINGGCTREVLDDAAAMNVSVIRTWGFADGYYYWGSMQPLLGNYNENEFRKLDLLIREASDREIKLIIPFVNNWDEYGGMCQYLKWCNVSWSCTNADVHNQFYTNECIRQGYKNYISFMLNRVNTYTGIAYKNDPTIFAWELANEPRAQTDYSGNILNIWIAEMSAYVKSIDQNHMVTTGAEGFYLNKGTGWLYDGSQGTDFITNHEHSTIDYASFHLYPDHWQISKQESIDWIGEHISDAHNVLGKPVILGEFGKKGILRNDYMNDWYAALRADSANGNLFWELVDSNYIWDADFGIHYPENASTLSIIAADNSYWNDYSQLLSPSNNAPVIQGIGDLSFSEGDLVQIDVTASDSDGDYVFLSINDAYRFDKDGNSFKWQTMPGDIGNYTIKITASDGVHESTETFNLKITEGAGCVVPVDGIAITSDAVLCNGSYYLPNGIALGQNAEIDCNGSEIYGANTGWGVTISGQNSSVRNCKIRAYKQGIQLLNAENTTIEGNEFISYMHHGVNMRHSGNSMIKGNKFTMNSDIGVYGYYSENNTIEDNNFTKNGKGVYFDGCDGNNISNNYFYFNYGGAVIFTKGSDRNTVFENYMNFNGKSWKQNGGVAASDSTGNTIAQNTVVNNYRGIILTMCKAHNISGNTIEGSNYGFGVKGTGIENYVHDISTSNTVNGDPIFYWVNEHNRDYPSVSGYIGIVNSSNITVSNIAKTNNHHGIMMAYTTNSVIEDSVLAYNSDAGVYLRNSDNITIRDVTAGNSSGGNGILAEKSQNLKITNSNATNSYYGIVLDNCDDAGITHSMSTGNWYGIELRSSLNGYVRFSDITGNRNRGVMLTYTTNATVENNNIHSNENEELWVYSSLNSSALNNWWGTVDCSAINNSVKDCQEGFSAGCANYSIVLNAPSPGGNPTSCADIACMANFDCGTNRWTENEYCQANNVWDTFRQYECINPGAVDAECTYKDIAICKEVCTDLCEEGSCVDVECYSDYDCGNNSWLGMDYCNADDVWDVFRTWTCSNPGKSSASCSFSDANLTKDECLDTCSGGACSSVVDLLVKSAKVLTKNLTTGRWITLQYVVENIGSAATGNASWELDTNSPQPNPSYGQFSVGAWETVDIYPSVKYAWPGNYTLVFSIDTMGIVDEHNETNNQHTMQLEIG